MKIEFRGRKPMRALKESICRMHESGMSDVQISERIGRSKRMVRYHRITPATDYVIPSLHVDEKKKQE